MNIMKTCNKCGNSKGLVEFGKKHDTKDGLMSICKICNKEKVNNWKMQNPEKAVNTSSNASKKWYSGNAQARKISMAQWQKLNPSKCASITAKRRSAQLLRTPNWLENTHFEQIENFYEVAEKYSAESGIKHEVDHIVPLQGKDVCGLHVPWNLQVIPVSLNRSKGNR